MSRTVPMDKKLTDEDRRYLRQLGSHGNALELRIDSDFPPNADALARFETAERKLAAEANGVGLTVGDQAALADENARLRAELAALRSAAPVTPNYNGWNKADLEAEIDRVNGEDSDAKLEKGKVGDMVLALTAYFSE